MTLRDSLSLDLRLEYIEKFEEGTELGDLVAALVTAAERARGIGSDSQYERILIIAEEIIVEYYQYCICDTDEFEAVDKDLFEWFIGYSKELVEEGLETDEN